MLHGPRPRNDHARRSVVAAHVGANVVARDGLYVVLAAQYGAAQRGAAVGGGVQTVEDDLAELPVHLLHLAQNGVALPLHVVLLHLAVLNDVCQDVHGLRHVALEHLGVEDGLLAAGVGVEVPAQVLHLHLQRLLGAARRAFERHVLQEVGHAVGALVLVAAARVDPDAHRGRLTAAALAGHAQTVGQRRSLWSAGRTAEPRTARRARRAGVGEEGDGLTEQLLNGLRR